MQVSVEVLDGLERCMTVQVPADTVDEQVQKRLVSLSRKARIDGFRPGKVPLKVIKRMYGPQVRQEVLGEVVQSSFQEALIQEDLLPAGVPKVEPVQSAEGHEFEYKATFEIYPEIEPQTIEGLKVTRSSAEVSEADIDKMLESLREQRVEWRAVQRPAQLKDQVEVSFEGKLEGEDFQGNKGDEVPIVLGSGGMVPGFEDQLIGLSAEGQTDFELTFPDDYPAQHLAGQTVNFHVDVHTVSEPVLSEIDEAFAENFGIKEGGVPALRQSLRENMARQLEDRIRSNVKQQVMQGLLDANQDVVVPQALVTNEIDNLAKQNKFPETGDDEAKQAELKTKIFADEARRRVTLGLIMSKLISANEIQADDDRVQSYLEKMAVGYEDREGFIQYYRQNTEAMQSLRAIAIEEQTVEWLLEKADVVEQTASFDDIMNPQSAKTDETQET